MFVKVGSQCKLSVFLSFVMLVELFSSQVTFVGCWQFWVAVSGFSVCSLHTAMLLLSLDADLLPQTKCMHVSLIDDYLFAMSVDTNINGCGPAICTLPLPLDKRLDT